MSIDGREELNQLRKEVKFDFIKDKSVYIPVWILYRVMQVSTSAYHAWEKRQGN